MPQKKRSGLYRSVWRWHFYAGVILTPIILVLAITGGIYIFKSEAEWVRNSAELSVAPIGERLSYEEQAAAARASLPDGYAVGGIEVASSPKKATIFLCLAPRQAAHRICVNPYTGDVLGELQKDEFFPWVLELHRNLFPGTTGRITVEFGTSWTIVLLITGIYLWWPKKSRQVRGVWIPRIPAKPYVVLRDLHTLAGMYLMPVILLISITGLLYSLVWGSSYRYASSKTAGGSFFANAPKSTGADGDMATLDQLVDTIRESYPYQPLSVFLPRGPKDSVTVFVRGDMGPSNHGYMVLHRRDASVLLNKPVSQFPATTRWATWNLALHVGTVGGMATKIVWLIACLVLGALPISGLWMWWQRRPAGRIGMPKRSAGQLPRWVLAAALALMLLLPVFGASLVVVLLLDWATMSLVRTMKNQTVPL